MVQAKNSKNEKLKKTNRAKYNWVKMKREFFESDFQDVAPFLLAKYKINTVQSSQSRERTKGWADEKREISEQLKIQAVKNFQSNLKKQWDAVFEKLEMAHVQGLEHLANMILEQ